MHRKKIGWCGGNDCSVGLLYNVFESTVSLNFTIHLIVLIFLHHGFSTVVTLTIDVFYTRMLLGLAGGAANGVCSKK